MGYIRCLDLPTATNRAFSNSIWCQSWVKKSTYLLGHIGAVYQAGNALFCLAKIELCLTFSSEELDAIPYQPSKYHKCLAVGSKVLAVSLYSTLFYGLSSKELVSSLHRFRSLALVPTLEESSNYRCQILLNAKHFYRCSLGVWDEVADIRGAITVCAVLLKNRCMELVSILERTGYV